MFLSFRKATRFFLYIKQTILSPVISFLLFLIPFYIMSFTIVNPLAHLFYINPDITNLIVVYLALFIDVVFTISSIVLRITKNEDIVGIWFEKNYIKATVISIISLICINVPQDRFWSSKDMSSILSLEWNIFGYALTVFLVWNVIINYLQAKLPQDSKASDSLINHSKYEHILEKIAFTTEVKTTFSTVILLTYNLILLLVCSFIVYLILDSTSHEIHLFILITFILSCSCLVLLFLDILKPLVEEKEKLLQISNYTKEEYRAEKRKNYINEYMRDRLFDIYFSRESFEKKEKHIKALILHAEKKYGAENIPSKYYDAYIQMQKRNSDNS